MFPLTRNGILLIRSRGTTDKNLKTTDLTSAQPHTGETIFSFLIKNPFSAMKQANSPPFGNSKFTASVFLANSTQPEDAILRNLKTANRG